MLRQPIIYRLRLLVLRVIVIVLLLSFHHVKQTFHLVKQKEKYKYHSMKEWFFLWKILLKTNLFFLIEFISSFINKIYTNITTCFNKCIAYIMRRSKQFCHGLIVLIKDNWSITSNRKITCCKINKISVSCWFCFNKEFWIDSFRIKNNSCNWFIFCYCMFFFDYCSFFCFCWKFSCKELIVMGKFWVCMNTRLP